jgi:hypothetical protein
VSHSPAASFLVLTEDGSEHSFATLQTLLCELLRYLEPHIRPERLYFDPVNDEARKLLSANQFADSKRYIERTRVHRTIAERLVIDTGFVIQHVDADRVWSDRDPSANVANLEKHIVAPVRQLVESRYRGVTPRQRRGKDTSGALPEADIQSRVKERMSRYIRFIPYREIEAWLYQNTTRAAALCRENPACRGKHVEKLASWRSDRGLLDELPRPAKELCFGKQHNSELARGYPTGEVVAAGKSLAAAVAAMLGCDALLHAIQRTHETTAGELEST